MLSLPMFRLSLEIHLLHLVSAAYRNMSTELPNHGIAVAGYLEGLECKNLHKNQEWRLVKAGRPCWFSHTNDHIKSAKNDDKKQIAETTADENSPIDVRISQLVYSG